MSNNSGCTITAKDFLALLLPNTMGNMANDFIVELDVFLAQSFIGRGIIESREFYEDRKGFKWTSGVGTIYGVRLSTSKGVIRYNPFSFIYDTVTIVLETSIGKFDVECRCRVKKLEGDEQYSPEITMPADIDLTNFDLPAVRRDRTKVFLNIYTDDSE